MHKSTITMEKRHEDISKMFNRIAKRYDLLNHLLSFGIDRYWRKELVNELVQDGAMHVLDMATGTADLAILAARKGVRHVDGVDIATAMLHEGQLKIQKLGLEESVKLWEGRAEDIPFPDQTFDAAMVAFGVRNFEDLDLGLKEMHRTLRTGGKISILEFSMPSNAFVKLVYLTYFRYLLPTLGGLISGDKKAYTYLPASVQAFPQGKDFLKHLEDAGFQHTSSRRFSGGIATLYRGMRV